MTKIRGRALLGILKYLKETSRGAEIPAILASLPSEAKAVFDQPLRASSWYPYVAYEAMLVALDQRFGSGDFESLADLGRYSLRKDANNILTILRVFASVEALVHRGFGSWGGYLWSRHCSRGNVSLGDHGPGYATMKLSGFPDVARAHCRLNVAYLEEMGRAVGASQITMSEVRCVHRGDSACEFLGDWREKG